MALIITSEHVFKIIKILAFIGFVSLFLFFGVFEVWNKFSKGSTNFESTKVSVEKLTPPTFLLCFKPEHRRSILTKNNLTMSDFSFINQNPEESDFLDIYYNSSYILGQDFDIKFYNFIADLQGQNLQEGLNQILDIDNEEKIIEIQKYSTFSYGLCYKITPQIIHLGSTNIYSILVKFRNSLPKEDIPEYVDFIITSEPNSYGAGMVKLITIFYSITENFLKEFSLFRDVNLEGRPRICTKCSNRKWRFFKAEIISVCLCQR